MTLQFVNENQIALPIHDGLIMRRVFAGDFKKVMQTALYDEFQADIPGTHEVVVQCIELLEENGTNDIETYQFIWRKPAPMVLLTRFNITKPK